MAMHMSKFKSIQITVLRFSVLIAMKNGKIIKCFQ